MGGTDPNQPQRPEFAGFNKISRLNREVWVTEKLDGTNAQIVVSDDGTTLWAGSRNKWITPEDDNAGFAKWVEANKEELLKLGPGQHFGEWWGAGIGRKYGLKEKRFSLFNTSRWGNPDTRPKCCGVVPVLWTGKLLEMDLRAILHKLSTEGSVAAPGFMNPEGVVLYHVAADALFKFTLDGNDESKWKTLDVQAV